MSSKPLRRQMRANLQCNLCNCNKLAIQEKSCIVASFIAEIHTYAIKLLHSSCRLALSYTHISYIIMRSSQLQHNKFKLQLCRLLNNCFVFEHQFSIHLDSAGKKQPWLERLIPVVGTVVLSVDSHVKVKVNLCDTFTIFTSETNYYEMDIF